MAKTRLNDFSTTANQNTDVNSVAMVGGSPISNIPDAIQNLAKMLADWIAGTYSIHDTAAVNDPTDITKKTRLDAGNVPTATTRALDAEALFNVLTYGYDRSTAFGTTLASVTETDDVPTGKLSAYVATGTQRVHKHADGTLIIRDVITLTFAATTRLTGTMTFGTSFVDANYTVSMSYRPANNASGGTVYASITDLGTREIGNLVYGNAATGSLIVTAFSNIGAAGNFGANDELYVDVTVIGRWY